MASTWVLEPPSKAWPEAHGSVRGAPSAGPLALRVPQGCLPRTSALLPLAAHDPRPMTAALTTVRRGPPGMRRQSPGRRHPPRIQPAQGSGPAHEHPSPSCPSIAYAQRTSKSTGGAQILVLERKGHACDFRRRKTDLRRLAAPSSGRTPHFGGNVAGLAHIQVEVFRHTHR